MSVNLIFQRLWNDLQGKILEHQRSNRYFNHKWVITAKDVTSYESVGIIKVNHLTLAPEEPASKEPVVGCGSFARVWPRRVSTVKKIYLQFGDESLPEDVFEGTYGDESRHTEKSPEEMVKETLVEFILFLHMYPSPAYTDTKMFRYAVDLDNLRNIRMTLPRLPGDTLDIVLEDAEKEDAKTIAIISAIQATALAFDKIGNLGYCYYDLHPRNLLGNGKEWHLIDFQQVREWTSTEQLLTDQKTELNKLVKDVCNKDLAKDHSATLRSQLSAIINHNNNMTDLAAALSMFAPPLLPAGSGGGGSGAAAASADFANPDPDFSPPGTWFPPDEHFHPWHTESPFSAEPPSLFDRTNSDGKRKRTWE